MSIPFRQGFIGAFAPDVAVLDAIQVQDLQSSSAGSRTISAGSNRVAFLIQYFTAGADASTTATYGGESMNLEAEIFTGSGFFVGVKIFSIDEAGIAAASGTAFSVSSPPTGGRIRYASISFENVDQTDISVDSGTGAESGTDPADVVLTTVAGGYAFAAAVINLTATCIWGSDLTELLDVQSEDDMGNPGGIAMFAAGAVTDGTDATADPQTSGTPGGDQQGQAAISLRKAA